MLYVLYENGTVATFDHNFYSDRGKGEIWSKRSIKDDLDWSVDKTTHHNVLCASWSPIYVNRQGGTPSATTFHRAAQIVLDGMRNYDGYSSQVTLLRKIKARLRNFNSITRNWR